MKTTTGQETMLLTMPMPILVDLKTGSLGDSAQIEHASKTLGQMKQMFFNETARRRMDSDTVVYSVEYWKPVQEGTVGGLFWGNSTIFPGMVGDEYFMTHGHFHARRDRGEYYSTVSGTGTLVLMDAQRRVAVQDMSAGSTHYIPGRIAHRVVNTGDIPLTFLACWPSDAGHDYTTIDEQGFSVRIMCRGGCPCVVAQA